MPDSRAPAKQSWHHVGNDFGRMVWEDWAEILRANAGRATLNRGRHNAQCLPVWKQSGPTLSAGCAHVGPSRAYVEPSGPCCAILGPILGECWATLGSCWGNFSAYVGPMLALCWPTPGLCWPTLNHLGTYVGPR